MGLVFDLILVAVFVLTVISAYKKGFLKSFCDAIGIFLGALGAYKLSGILDVTIYDKFFREGVISSIQENLTASTSSAGSAQAMFSGIPELLTRFASVFGLDMNELSSNLSNVDLTGKNAAELLAENVAQPIVTTVIRVVLFVLLAIIFTFVLGLISRFITKLIKKTPLNAINKFFGGIFGLVKGALIVVILLAIITLVAGIINIEVVNEAIDNSYVVEILKSSESFLAVKEINCGR